MREKNASVGSGYGVASRGNHEDSVAYSSSIGNYASNEASAVWVANARTAMRARVASNARSSDRNDSGRAVVIGRSRRSSDSAARNSGSEISERSNARDRSGKSGSITANALDRIDAKAWSGMDKPSPRYPHTSSRSPRL